MAVSNVGWGLVLRLERVLASLRLTVSSAGA